jgi:hypothetical protein
MSNLYLSPKYRESHFNYIYSLDDKINIFEDQIYGWTLNIAEVMVAGKTDDKDNYLIEPIAQSEQAALNLVLSYFEMIGHFKLGVGRPISQQELSKAAFTAGLKDVFQGFVETNPSFKEIVDIFYTEGRCGLYHLNQMGGRFVIAIDPNFVWRYSEYDFMAVDRSKKTPTVSCNIRNLVALLKQHFSNFMGEVKNPANATMRAYFETWFDHANAAILNKTPPPPPVLLSTVSSVDNSEKDTADSAENPTA